MLGNFCLGIGVWMLGRQAPSKGPLDLARATSIALASRLSIRAQEERVLVARSKLRELSALPPLRVEAGYGTRPELGIGQDLLLALPIDLFGKVNAQEATARADLATAQAALSQAAQDLQTEVFTSFSDLQSAQELYASAQEVAKLEVQLVEATRARIASGDLAPNEQYRIDLEAKRSDQTLHSRRAALESAKIHLQTVLGDPTLDVDNLSANQTVAPQPRPISQRPDIVAASAAIDAARAERRVARSSSAPEVELQLARDYWDASGKFVGRVQVVWNFLDFGAAAARSSQANHSLKSASLSLKDLISLATDQAKTTRIDLDSANEEVAVSDQLIADAETLLARERIAFAAGASTLLDVIDATRSVRDLRESAVQARARAVLAESKYLAATGTLLGTLPNPLKK